MKKQKVLLFTFLLGISIIISSCKGSKIKNCDCGSFSQTEQNTQALPQ